MMQDTNWDVLQQRGMYVIVEQLKGTNTNCTNVNHHPKKVILSIATD